MPSVDKERGRVLATAISSRLSPAENDEAVESCPGR